jgi:hypothetical protein
MISEKSLLFILLFLATNSFSQSLCQKGSWLVGCNFLNYNFFETAKNSGSDKSMYHYFSPDTSFTIFNSWKDVSEQPKVFSLILNIGFGYFVKDNLIIGGAFTNLIPSSVYFRYYLGQKKHRFHYIKENNAKRWAFFIQGGLDAGFVNSKKKVTPNTTIETGEIRSNSYYINPRIGTGGTYLITKHFALESSLSYSFRYSGNKSNSTTNLINPSGIQQSEQQSNGVSHGFNFLFGIQTYF